MSLFVICTTISCKPEHIKLTDTESLFVKESVAHLVADIADDVSKKGPSAWLHYFDEDPGFFMASQGKISFENYRSAKTFVLDTLAKNIRQMKLKWKDIRIDPLKQDLASIGAGFHEDITDVSRKTISVDGYFTGLAHYDGIKWKLRNLHWSTMMPGK
jgi:hypothetical protein